MNLDDAQKKSVAAWIAEGLKLSDIQKRIGAEFGLNLTYMEVRLLVDDLKLVPKDPPPKLEKPLVSSAPNAAANHPPAHDEEAEPALDPAAPAASPGTGKVSLSVDALARPGAIVSGSVTFSDGQVAIWYMDQFGRMGIGPRKAGYKPSAAD